MDKRTFKIPKDPHDIDRNLYLKTKININKGLTILVGHNGAGKTTLITLMKESLKRQNIPYYSFNNYYDGGSKAKNKAGFLGDIDFLAKQIVSSEGEEIKNNLVRIAREVGQFTRDHKNDKELWFFFDALDSGMDVYELDAVKRDFFHFILEHEESKDIYIITSCNNFELARDENCLCIPDLKYRNFKDYEEYKKYIIESKDKYYYLDN